MHPRILHLTHALWSLVLLGCALPAAATGPDTHEVGEALAVGVNCALPAATGPDLLDITSAALGETRHVEVHLPPSYAWATERRYPVLYLLDGQTHGGHAVASSDFLAAQGQLPELIVVSVHSTVRVRDFTQTDWPQVWTCPTARATSGTFRSCSRRPSLVRRPARTERPVAAAPRTPRSNTSPIRPKGALYQGRARGGRTGTGCGLGEEN